MAYPFEEELNEFARNFLKNLTDDEAAYLEYRIESGGIENAKDLEELITVFVLTRAGVFDDEDDEEGMFSPEEAEVIGEADGKPIYKVTIT